MSIITVDGKINKEEAGIILPHEHIFCDTSFTFKEPVQNNKIKLESHKVEIGNLYLLKNNMNYLKDNLFIDDEEVAIKELNIFKQFGGNTIVDVSSIGVTNKRDKIKEISKKTSLNIVQGTGYYIADALPREIINLSIDNLFKNIMYEIENGIDGSGAKPGIIGELGIGPEIGDWEEKILKASAKAQKETGLAISVHIQAVPTLANFKGNLNGLEAIKILEKEGTDIEKVVICHTDAKVDMKYLKSIAKSGAYFEFDHIGKDFYFQQTDFLMDRDMDRVMAIKEVIESGYIDRILISQDICLKTDLISYGGFGYAHILRDFIPMMKNKGITENDIRKIIVENPANLIDIDKRFL